MCCLASKNERKRSRRGRDRERLGSDHELLGNHVLTLLATIVAFPIVVHHIVKSELDNSKNTCINPKTRKIGTA